MKKFLSLVFVMLTFSSISLCAKTLVVYYSYTGNCHEIVQTLISQIEADTLRIYPADKTQQYEANNYAIGTQLLNAINADPYNADSYPEIDPVDVDLANYDTYIIVTPLWWSQMAAILQTYLFHHGPEMAGKNVGLIVSSYSSGISTVVANAQRLIPDAAWMGEALWINNANHSNRATLIENWLVAINYAEHTATHKVGDVNGDNEVTIGDVSALIDMLLSGDTNNAMADVNGDHEVTIGDFSALIDILLNGDN